VEKELFKQMLTVDPAVINDKIRELENKILELKEVLQKQELLDTINKPEHWDNWSVERQLGYNFAIDQIKQPLNK